MKIRKYIFYIIILLVFVSCSLDDSVIKPADSVSLVLDYEVGLDIAEPSGLTYDPNTQTLWLVNDPPNNKIYNISLEGELLETLSFVGDDLEGIAYDIDANTLWIAEEALCEIVNVSLSGEEIERIDIPVSQYSTGSGLEGLCIVSPEEFYLLIEKDPGRFIEFNPELPSITETVVNFADDFSGICYNAERDGFWIVSDESEKLYLWDSENGVREEYSLYFPKAEGIIYVADTNSFYIVSDSEEKLYKFHIEER